MPLRITNGFDRLSDAKLNEKTSFILSQLTGNTNFPTPDPSLADVSAALTAFSQSMEEAQTGDRLKIAAKNQKREALINLLHLLSTYVVFAAKGDRIVAMSSGFTLAKEPAPAPEISKPTNLKVMNSDQSGEMKVSVDAVPEAVAYLHQFTTDAALKEESWQTTTCSQSKYMVTGLKPGTLYYWRVGAVGRKDQVLFSDVVSRVAA